MDARSSELILAQKPEALRMLQGARMWLMERLSFYGVLLSGLQFVENHTWCDTIATDHKRIYYNPEFIMGVCQERRAIILPKCDDKMKEQLDAFYAPKTLKEVAFLLCHEIGHIIADHLSRGKAFSDHNLFNQAADHVINTGLMVDLAEPPCAMFPHGIRTQLKKGQPFAFLEYCYCDKKYHGWITEKVYADLERQQQQQGKGQSASGGGGQRATDTHMGDGQGQSDNLSEAMGYEKGNQPSMTQAEKDAAMQDSGDMMEAAMQAAGGEGPAQVREWIKNRNKPVINYLDVIRQRMLSHRKADMTYRRPARRSGALTHTLRSRGAINNRQSVILPGRNQEKTIDIVVAFDVSGSISPRTLKRITSEISGLCSLYKEFKVTMFCWSTEVGDVQVYTHQNIAQMPDYNIKSTFGTRAGCVFEYLDKNLSDIQDVIIFTDLFLESGFEKEVDSNNWDKYNTLWIRTEGGNKDYTPSFGRTIDLIENVK